MVEYHVMPANPQHAVLEHPPAFPQLARYLAERSPQPMVAVEGLTHIIRYANPAFRRLLGKEDQHLIGRLFAEAVPEGLANGCAPLLDRVFATGTPEMLAEQEHSPRDAAVKGEGETPPMHWSYSVWAILGPVVGEAEEKPVGVMIQVTDATETAAFRKSAASINEALLVSGVRQHELQENSDRLNTALRENEELLRTMADAMPQLAWMAKADGFIHWYNRRWYKYTGTASAQMEGWGWQSVHDPEVLPKVLERWKASIAGGEPFEMVFPLRGADGRFRSFLTRVLPLRDADGKVAQWFGTNTDIDDVKRTEQALRESEERYRTLFDLGPVAVYSCDVSGVIQNFNRTAVELWGRQPKPGDTDERFCGSFKLYRPDGTFVPHDQSPMAEVLSGKIPEVRDMEVQIERPNASWVTVIVNIRPLKNERGEITGAINGFVDITGRKLVERKFRGLLESAPDAMIITNQAGQIALINTQTEIIFSYSSDELIGKPIEILIPKRYREGHPAHRHTFMADPRVRPMGPGLELWALRKDGTEFPVEISLSPLETEEGILVTAAVRDITERKETENKLRASEARFRTLFELGPVAVYSCEVSGVIREFNRTAVELWGRQPKPGDTDERFCGSFKLYRPDGTFMPHDQCPMAEVLSGKIPEARDREVQIQRPDGSRVIVLVNIRPLRNERGEITGAINCFVDITERKEAEEKLRESERKYRALFDSIDEGFCIIEKVEGAAGEPVDFRYLEANAAFAVQSGISGMVGKTLGQMIPGEAVEWCKIYDTILKTGEPIRFERYLDTHGRALELYAFQVEDETHRRVAVIFKDITGRKQAEEALRASEEQNRKLFQSVPAAVFTCDREGVVQDYNRRAEEYWGRAPVRGDPTERYCGSFNLYLPDGTPLPHEQSPMVDVLRDGIPRENVEVIIERPDGSRLPVIVNFFPLIDAGGDITGAIVCFSDIMQVKRFEREREALLANEQASRMEAETANRSKDLFLATLSHEMRTPLNAIVGWMGILRTEGCDEADLREGLDVIERNTRVQVQLIDDVLDVARIVSGKLRLEIQPCELTEVVRAGIDVVRPSAQAKNITLNAELDPAANRAVCDPVRMQQVVWNLVANAVKFTPRGGTVSVALSREQSTVKIRVTDTGQGMSAELLPYVFDRFHQADSSTRRKFGGLGLGLSIVKQLVEMHGGTVEAYSAGEGSGSTFTVILPTRSIHPVDESGDELEAAGVGKVAEESEHAAPSGLPVVRLDGLRLLVVEDEADARRLLVKVLEQAGATVIAAGSAAEAMAALKRGGTNVPPHVLVSDIGMPDEDGFDLIRQVRQAGHTARDLPAVALTAFAHKEDRRQVLLAGFQVHVPKPVDPHDLTAVIASLAGRTG